jgi:hypothetical protein
MCHGTDALALFMNEKSGQQQLMDLMVTVSQGQMKHPWIASHIAMVRHFTVLSRCLVLRSVPHCTQPAGLRALRTHRHESHACRRPACASNGSPENPRNPPACVVSACFASTATQTAGVRACG